MQDAGTRNTRSIRWTPGLLQLPAPVAAALTLFAERTREIALHCTAGWMAGGAMLLFTVLAAADGWFRMEAATRQTAALITYLSCGVLAQWMISRALRRRSPEEIAVEMEDCAPRGLLEERLITTVELSTRRANPSHAREDEGIAQPLADRVADEAAQLLLDSDVESWANRRPEQLALRFAAGAMVLAVGLCLIPGLSMPIRYARAMLPWVGLARPSQTQISLVPRNPRVVEGAEVTFEAELFGVPAPECFLETRDARGSWQRTRMERNANGPFTLKLGPVSTALHYRAVAGDGETLDYEIDVLPRPDIATLNFTVTEPEYTKRPAQTFERASGDVEILRGSNLELAVKSTVSLSGAVLEFSDGRRVTMAVDGVYARAAIEVARDMSYRVRLQSRDGVDNPDSPLFGIRAIADRAPQVSILQPSPDTDADPAQIQALDVRIEDDIGLKSARLVVRSDRRANPSNVALNAPDSAAKNWIISYPWDLAALFPEEGEILYYRVEAVDSGGVTGRSDERRLHVTSGLSRGSGRVLLEIERAQKSLQAATKMLQTALRDAGEIQQVFRPQDLDTRSAERLLLDDTLKRAVAEIRSAAASIERAQSQADGTTLLSVLSALRNGLVGLSEGDLGSLQRAAARLHGSDPQRIQAGLDALLALAPPAQSRLEILHSGVTAAQRFVGAQQLETRANEIKEIQARITPVLVGASGWSNDSGNQPGLRMELFRGVELSDAVQQSTEARVYIKDADFPGAGKNNFSVRYTGEVQAPRAGRYIFRVSADDGVRASVDGKRIIDEWRSQSATVYDGAVELTEGWHALLIEYFQGTGSSELTLQRSGPGAPMGEIPREQLRRRAQVQRMQQTDELTNAMKQGASPLAIQNALVRQQSIVRMARALPATLIPLAELPPAVDADGKNSGTAWSAEITTQTTELSDVKNIHAGLAKPLLNWQAQTAAWAERFTATRVRYQKDLENWAKRATPDKYDFTARLRNMQRRASAASKAFTQLTDAAKKPESPQREAEMNRADAAIRALSQDLQRQTQEIARDLNSAAGDPRRRIQERLALKALEARVRDMADDPGSELERRLEEARDPEQLAQSAGKTPNFGSQAEQLARDSGELSNRTEQFERLRAATERAGELARAGVELRAALERAPTLESSGQQRRAVQALRHAAQQLAEQAEEPMDGATAEAAKQTAGAVLQNAALQRVEERAVKMAAGDFSLEAPPAAELAKANTSQDAVNAAAARAMEQIATQLNGSATALAQDAAKRTADAAAAIAKLDTNPAALSQATQQAEDARRIMQSLAERLALESELQRDRIPKVDLTQTAAALQAVENKMRLAALINDIQQRNSGPLARDLSSHIGTPDEGTRAQLRRQADEAAARLDSVAKMIDGVLSANKDAQKDAVAKLNKDLDAAGLAAAMDRALERSQTLNAVADALMPAKNGIKTEPGKEQYKAKPGTTADELAHVTGQTAVPRRVALAERTSALADRLRNEAEVARVAAQRIQGVSSQQSAARESLGRELPQAVSALQSAASETAAFTGLSGVLTESARALEGLQARATNMPSAELTQQLAGISEGLLKPLNELTAQKGDAAKIETLRTAGERLRQTLGRLNDWSSDVARAERASGHAERDVAAQRGSRHELEQQVHAALEALDREKTTPAEADAVRTALKSNEVALPQRSEKSGGVERTEKLAETLRADADRLGTLAAGLSRVAQALDTDAPTRKLPATHADAAVQSALQALGEADAAEQTGATADAGRASERASQLLDYAAEAERDRAGGLNQLSPWPLGGDVSHSSRRPGAAPKSAPRPTPGNLKTPPPGLPIDLATWNRLPEAMRKDLLNAQSQRFPAEYEQSIRRYFKNLASAKEDER